MQPPPTTERTPNPTSSDESKSGWLPEWDVGQGLRIREHQTYGRWLVSTRGDLIHFRLKHKDDETKKETIERTATLIIAHDRLTERNWIADVRRRFPRTDMNPFLDAYEEALALNDLQMGRMEFRRLEE